jgi:hypothetical protein
LVFVVVTALSSLLDKVEALLARRRFANPSSDCIRDRLWRLSVVLPFETAPGGFLAELRGVFPVVLSVEALNQTLAALSD